MSVPSSVPKRATTRARLETTRGRAAAGAPPRRRRRHERAEHQRATDGTRPRRSTRSAGGSGGAQPAPRGGAATRVGTPIVRSISSTSASMRGPICRARGDLPRLLPSTRRPARRALSMTLEGRELVGLRPAGGGSTAGARQPLRPRRGRGARARRCPSARARRRPRAPPRLLARTSARVVSETRIWPPRASAQMREARTTSTTEVALVADGRLARVQPIRTRNSASSGHGSSSQRALRRDGRCDRLARAREDGEERVALAVDLPAAGRCERLAQEPVVRGERRLPSGRRAAASAASSPRCPRTGT